MMYSSLNTILQFICAIYVTIVFDNILFRRFWAPDYYLILQKNIRGFGLPITQELNNWLTNIIKRKNNAFKNRSRKRGSIFLFTDLLVIISIAIINNDDQILTIPFGCLFVFSYLILFLMPTVLKRWLFLIVGLLLEAIGFFILVHFCKISFYPDGYLYKIIASIILLSILPIIYQIIKSWIFSTAIRCYVITNLNTIAAEYFKARQSVQNQDKTIIPASYQPAFSQMAYDIPQKDIQLTQINEHLVSILKDKFDKIKISTILISYWKNPKYEYNVEYKPLSDEKQSVDQVEPVGKVNEENISEYENYIEEYRKLKNPPKIEDFCKQKGIDVMRFKELRNKNLPAKINSKKEKSNHKSTAFKKESISDK